MKPWMSSNGGPDPAVRYRHVKPSISTLCSTAPSTRAMAGTGGVSGGWGMASGRLRHSLRNPTRAVLPLSLWGSRSSPIFFRVKNRLPLARDRPAYISAVGSLKWRTSLVSQGGSLGRLNRHYALAGPKMSQGTTYGRAGPTLISTPGGFSPCRFPSAQIQRSVWILLRNARHSRLDRVVVDIKLITPKGYVVPDLHV